MTRRRTAAIFYRKACSLLLPGLLLSGCSLLPAAPTEHMQEPPLIPEFSMNAAPSTELSQKSSILTYADLIDFNDAGKYHPKLREAVETALQVGVLKPASTNEAFNPQNPITYGEFRTWTIAYLNAASANPAENATNQSTDKPTPDKNPMNPNNLLIPPSNMQWGEHTLVDTRPLTREELCALYSFLSKQDDAARALSADNVEAMVPKPTPDNPDGANPNEALGQFKDWNAIGPWARRYVAIAYQDNLMNRLFRLSPSQLAVDEGFQPQQTLTRSDAIVLLHSLYGQAALAQLALRPKLVEQADPSTNANDVSPDAAPTEKPAAPAEPSPPISKLKSVQETGPNGTRSAIQVTKPQ